MRREFSLVGVSLVIYACALVLGSMLICGTVRASELEHRNLDRHGSGWKSERDGVAADQGWPLYLQRFADLVTGGS
jgi:hypothetical protein